MLQAAPGLRLIAVFEEMVRRHPGLGTSTADMTTGRGTLTRSRWRPSKMSFRFIPLSVKQIIPCMALITWRCETYKTCRSTMDFKLELEFLRLQAADLGTSYF